MRRIVVVAAMVLTLAVFGGGTGGAETISPADGNAFGQHVASMAPEHPQDHGQLFGECVGSLAVTGTCPHHP